VRTRSPEIYLGKTVHEFLRCLDVPITRGERGSLRVYANQLLRLIHCAVSIDENIRDGAGRTGLHIRQALFAQPRKFRHFFLDSLKRVMAVYPEANVKAAEVGLILAPSRPHVPRDHRVLAR
jgi:hypothetical protein